MWKRGKDIFLFKQEQTYLLIIRWVGDDLCFYEKFRRLRLMYGHRGTKGNLFPLEKE